MRTCAKCGKEGYVEDVAPLILAGGYSTDLCFLCKNQFHEHAWPQMIDIRKLEVRMNAAITAGDGDLASEIIVEMHLEKSRLYMVSKTWVEGE